MKIEKTVTKTIKQCINVSASRVDSLRNNDSTESTVRYYDNGCIGVAGEIGIVDIEQLTAKAKANLKQAIPYPETQDAKAQRNVDVAKEIISAEQFVPTIEKLVARLSKENPEFIFSNKVIMEDFERKFSSSCGIDYHYHGKQFDLGLAIKHKASANIMDEFVSGSCDYYDEDQICHDAKLTCDNFLHNIPQVEEDEITVIINYEGLLSGLLNHFVAEMYCNGASLLSGKMGQQVFNEKLNVVLDRNPERQLNVPFFDAEGVVNEDDVAYLVKDGKFNGLLTTKRTANMYGVENIGCAGASYTGVPSVGIGGLSIVKTAESLEELVKGKAVYVSSASGGDVTPSGDASLPCLVSYLYQDGKLQGKLPEFTISANLFDMLGKDFVGFVEKGLFQFGKRNLIVTKAKLVNKKQ